MRVMALDKAQFRLGWRDIRILVSFSSFVSVAIDKLHQECSCCEFDPCFRDML
jgi:hypothetical protein